MLKNVTVTVDEEVLRWARREAADREMSVSRLVGQMLSEKMHASGEYWKAYERWKKIKPWPIRASERLTREEAHERRR